MINSRRHTLGLLAIVLLLTVTMTVALVHWHQDGRDHDCQLCHARQLPSIYTPVASLLLAPVTREWKHEVARVVFQSVETSSTNSGRAPPQSYSC